MSPQWPFPDPLTVAQGLAEEAENARGDWRVTLVARARAKLDEATAGMADQDDAVAMFGQPIRDVVRAGLDARRREIERMAARLEALAASAGSGE